MMRRTILARSSTSMLLLLLAGATASARVWIVAPDGTGDFTMIQEAIDAAGTGDEIRIRPGTYLETLNLRGKILDLIGEAGAEATVVDADGAGSVLQVPFTPGGGGLVRGLTFTNGIGTIQSGPQTDGRAGGGIYVELAAVRFEDCRIAGNIANDGGGIYVLAGAPRFLRCSIRGNAAGSGGGVKVDIDGGARFEDCVIDSNEAVFGGGIDSFQGRCVVDGGAIIANTAFEGGAVRMLEAGEGPVRITGALLASNSADRGAAILGIRAAFDVTGSTIAENVSGPTGASVDLENGVAEALRSTVVAASGPGEPIQCAGGGPILECVVLWPPPRIQDPCGLADQVLIADPLFCGAPGGDYTVRSDSPCLPGQGPPGCGQIGAFGAGCQVPVPTISTTWGSLKALYR